MIGTGDSELITNVIASFTRDNKLLKKQLLDILYYMRGALTRDDMWQLTPLEREEYVEFLNDRFEQAGELMKKDVSVFV